MATLETRLQALITAIGSDISARTSSLVATGNVSGTHTFADAKPSPAETVETVTMTADTTFSLGTFPAGISTVTVILAGNFTPTLPGTILWADGTPPTHDGSVGPSVFTLMSVDGGTTVYGFRGGESFS